MCGFLVYLPTCEKKINFSDELIDSSLMLRGPDQKGKYEDDNIKILFYRLAIVDIKGPPQPFADNTDRFLSVFNGEIYNFRELKKELINKGEVFYTNCDAEIIPSLFKYYGLNFIHKIRGMFSIVIWDKINCELFAFRDRLGIKPLYYNYHQTGGLFISSEIRAIESVSNSNENFSIDYISEYLMFGYGISESTINSSIKRCLPAHYIHFKNNSVNIIKYWDNFQQEQNKSLEEIELEFENSITYHSTSEVPVGIYLSGGLDSSALACAYWQKCQKMDAYTLKFSDNNFDESELALKISRKYNAKHIIKNVSTKELVEQLPFIHQTCDEPIADTGILPNYFISKLAKENGSKVIISGTGGDEIFGGYGYYFPNKWEILLKNFWPKIPINFLQRSKRMSMLYKITRSLQFYNNPLTNYSAHKSLFFDINQIHKLEKINPNNKLTASSSIRMYADIETYLPNNLLTILDRSTMAHSIEGRVPLLDHILYEAVKRCEISKITDPVHTKIFLRNFLTKNKAPSAVLDAPKKGFNGPINIWCNLNRKKIESFLLSTDCSIPKLNILTNYKKILSNSDNNQIWSLFYLETFMSSHRKRNYNWQIRDLL